MYHKYITDYAQLIIRDSDGAWIPMDPNNTDYQQFLQYLADNNLTLNDIPDYII